MKYYNSFLASLTKFKAAHDWKTVQCQSPHLGSHWWYHCILSVYPSKIIIYFQIFQCSILVYKNYPNTHCILHFCLKLQNDAEQTFNYRQPNGSIIDSLMEWVNWIIKIKCLIIIISDRLFIWWELCSKTNFAWNCSCQFSAKNFLTHTCLVEVGVKV